MPSTAAGARGCSAQSSSWPETAALATIPEDQCVRSDALAHSFEDAGEPTGILDLGLRRVRFPPVLWRTARRLPVEALR